MKQEKKLWESATKIVFLIITIWLIAGFFTWKITSEQFMPVVFMVFGFYFGKNQNINSLPK